MLNHVKELNVNTPKMKNTNGDTIGNLQLKRKKKKLQEDNIYISPKDRQDPNNCKGEENVFWFQIRKEYLNAMLSLNRIVSWKTLASYTKHGSALWNSLKVL